MVAGYNAKIAALEQEGREKTQVGASIPKPASPPKSSRSPKQLADAVAALEQTEEDLQERTAWALRLEEEKRQLEDQLNMVRASRWIKLGRKVGLGPRALTWPS